MFGYNDFVQVYGEFRLVGHYDLNNNKHHIDRNNWGVTFEYEYEEDYSWLYKMSILYGANDTHDTYVDIGTFGVYHTLDKGDITGEVGLVLNTRSKICYLEIMFLDCSNNFYDSRRLIEIFKTNLFMYRNYLVLRLNSIDVAKAFVQMNNFCLECCDIIFRTLFNMSWGR